ncbi:MAG: PilZ domain-containing protein [Pseudomonadota bacterium]
MLINEFLEDVQRGLTDGELRHKYKLPREGLRSIAKRLLRSRKRDPSIDVNTRDESYPGMVVPARRSPRFSSLYWIPVYDEAQREVGTLLDIHDKGFGVEGIETAVGEVRQLLIGTNLTQNVEPFRLEAKCRWVRIDDQTQEVFAGFEIVDAAPNDRIELSKLVELLKFKE